DLSAQLNAPSDIRIAAWEPLPRMGGVVQPRAARGAPETQEPDMNLLSRRTIAVATFVLAALAPLVAAEAAKEVLANECVTVRYGDLDLNTGAGVAQLYERLKEASQRACRTGDAGLFYSVFQRKHCYDGALAAAVSSAHLAALVDVHE